MKRKQNVLSLALALAMAVSVTACTGASSSVGGSDSAASSAAATPTPAAATAEAALDDTSYYPVTVTTYDYAGNEITTTYDKAPERVICVYQGCIETMIALGLEDHVVASYGLDNPVKAEWEDGLARMNYNEDVFAPDKETVTMLNPDMIFSWGSLFSDKNLGDAPNWIDEGVNTYISTNTRRGGYDRTLENEYTDLLNIGKIFNVEDKAQALVDEMEQEIAGILDETAGQASPRVAIIEFLGDSISNYGANQLGGSMVEALGGTLVSPDASEIGKEDLVALDPDVIFVVYMAHTDTVEAESVAKVTDDPAFADLAAVKNGRVVPIMLGDMYASTVRSIDGIRAFAAGMYPDLAV